MCLGVPLKLLEVHGDTGVVEMGGVRRKVNLSLVPEVKTGNYVIVHAGFAITVMNEEEAEETLRLLNEIMEKTEE